MNILELCTELVPPTKLQPGDFVVFGHPELKDGEYTGHIIFRLMKFHSWKVSPFGERVLLAQATNIYTPKIVDPEDMGWRYFTSFRITNAAGESIGLRE